MPHKWAMAVAATTLRDKLDAEIEARLDGGTIEQYTLVGGRQVKKTPLETLMKWRSQLQSEAAAESRSSNALRVRIHQRASMGW